MNQYYGDESKGNGRNKRPEPGNEGTKKSKGQNGQKQVANENLRPIMNSLNHSNQMHRNQLSQQTNELKYEKGEAVKNGKQGRSVSPAPGKAQPKGEQLTRSRSKKQLIDLKRRQKVKDYDLVRTGLSSLEGG